MKPEDLGIGSLFERVRDAVVVADAETQRIILWNPAATEIFGYSLEEALNMRVEALVPDPLKPRHRAGMAHYGKTGQGEFIDSRTPLDLPAVRKDGQEVRIELSLSPIGEEVQPGGERLVLAIMRDITARKVAEERLRESEAELRAVFGAMDDVIFVFDGEGRYLEVAPTQPSLLYRPADEITGKTLHEVLPPDRADLVLWSIRRVLETGQREAVEYDLDIGGRRTWFTMTVSPMLEGTVVAVARDITDRKRAETRIREAETRYRTIIENIPAAVYIQPADDTGALTYISPYTEKILGYPRKDLTSGGENWISLLHPDDRALVLAEDTRTNETGEPLRIEYRQRASDGRYVWIRQESVLVRDEDGEPLYWQGFLWDITDRKQAEEEIRRLNETLEQRVAVRTSQLAEREARLRELLGKLVAAQEEERRRVAYEVHDGLAQMIVAVQQHLQAFSIQHPPESSQGRRSLDWNLDLIQQTVEEARRVIGGLRPTALDDFGLASALRLQVETLRSEGWEIGYEETLKDKRLPATHETALYRIAQEALTNVRKHADTTRVRIKLGQLGRNVRLSVRDRGKGFEPASQTGRGGPGERVGVSGMEERVRLLGGEFEVRSRPGSGTLVVVRVPLPDSVEGERGA